MPVISGSIYKGTGEVPEMPVIFTRYEKGQALTHAEMDTNLTSLLHTCSVSETSSIKDAQFVEFQYASQSLVDGQPPIFCRPSIRMQISPSSDDVLQKLANETVPGNLDIQDKLSVGGDLVASKNLEVDQDVNVGKDVKVGQNLEIGQDLYVSGTLHVSEVIYEKTFTEEGRQSDARLKEHVSPFVNSLDRVYQIEPVNFIWKEGAERSGADVGVIAQQLEQVYPDAVSRGQDGYLRVNYEKLVPLLIGAVKELADRYVALENRIQRL